MAALHRILIVEDYDTLAQIEALVAVTGGYEVKVASSQAEALATALSWRPDLIILDLVLWGDSSGGEHFLTALAEEGVVLPPVLIVSAIIDEATAEGLRQHYPRLTAIRKPFKVKELTEAMADVLPTPGRRPRSGHVPE
jgi:DNA-binding response OmpR family regulator